MASGDDIGAAAAGASPAWASASVSGKDEAVVVLPRDVKEHACNRIADVLIEGLVFFDLDRIRMGRRLLPCLLFESNRNGILRDHVGEMERKGFNDEKRK